MAAPLPPREYPPALMRVMAVDTAARELRLQHRPVPQPGPHQVLLRVLACGVCRTDLHVLDGDLPPHRAGVVPGHEVVGEVVAHGAGSRRLALGSRVGVPWLGGTCRHCQPCRSRHENLCEHPVFTGYDVDGGFADYMVADERYCLALPSHLEPAHTAPLLCAGLIGYRAWRMAGGVRRRRLGLYGFGAAAHILCQLAVALGQQVYAFTRAGDVQGQAFARSLGACWAGDSAQAPPEALDAALIFASAGELVPAALAATRPGGQVVCAGIHMSDIPRFPYRLLWGERSVRSVANLTRADGGAFFEQLRSVPLQPRIQAFGLEDANTAVRQLRAGAIAGAAVLVP